MKRLFVDVHVIQTVPPSRVNRDDTGSPKTAMYGGVRRARVSSQSWKSEMRSFFKEILDEDSLGIRTVRVVELLEAKIREIDPKITEDDATEKAKSILTAMEIPFDNKEKEDGGIEYSSEKKRLAALFFISTKQIENLANLAISEETDKKKIKEALNDGNSIDIMLFGRMVAKNATLNVDAAAQVAHSISTHKVDNEYDYYTAIDDLSPEGTTGAEMIGTVEYNSSTMYRYATLALHDLLSGLSDKDAAVKATNAFIRAFILSMPRGGQNTFANRTVPDAVFISIRNDQPVNLAGAFESPVISEGKEKGYALKSAMRLADYEKEVCSTFVSSPVRAWQMGEGLSALGKSTDLQTTLSEIEAYLLKEL